MDREIQDSTNPGIVRSSLISMGRNLVMPVQFLFSKASLAPGQLPPCNLSRFIISHSSLSTGKTDQGVVSNWGFWKSPSCTELQVMDFKNKLGPSGRYLLVQEVTHREFNWIHPKLIGQESRSCHSQGVPPVLPRNAMARCLHWCCTECISAPGCLCSPSAFPPDFTPGWVHC